MSRGVSACPAARLGPILLPMPLAVRVIAYAGVAVLLFSLALVLFRRPLRGAGSGEAASGSGGARRETARGAAHAGGGAGLRHCPLCGSSLQPGEKVSSRVFVPKGDRIMHIFGCPRCWPSNIVHARRCPVCEREVPREGYVIARLFERQTGRHVHVLGCSACRETRT